MVKVKVELSVKARKMFHHKTLAVNDKGGAESTMATSYLAIEGQGKK